MKKAYLSILSGLVGGFFAVILLAFLIGTRYGGTVGGGAYDSNLVFEGSTANDFETTIYVTNPTADRTVTLKDESGTVAYLTDAGEDAFTVESVPGTLPTATGTDAIGIGEGAVAGNASGDGGVLAIGKSASAVGSNSIAIGQNSDALQSNGVAVGYNAQSTQNGSIALGQNSISNQAGSIAIGQNADATGTGSIAIGGSGQDGNSADATGSSSIAIGQQSDATALRSIAFGWIARATATEAIAIGNAADATGGNCIAIGGNVTDTDSADCSAADSVAIGQHVLANDIGEFAFASGEFAVQSDAHTSIFVLRNSTTDGTQTEVFANGTSGDISVPTDCTTAITVSIVARRTDVDGESAYYVREAVFDNNAGTTAIVGPVQASITIEDTAAWDVALSADNSNNGINVLVTGEAAKTIRWVARAEVVEVCG